MNEKIDAFLELTAHPEVGPHVLSGRAAWVWSEDGTRILWANAAGGAFFGADSVGPVLARNFGAESPTARQIAGFVTAGEVSVSQLERLRFFIGLRAHSLTAAVTPIRLASGALAVLVASAEALAGPARRGATADAFADFLANSHAVAAVLDPYGEVIGASGRYEELSDVAADIDKLLTDAEIGEMPLISRDVLTAEGERRAGVARIVEGDEICHVLIVWPPDLDAGEATAEAETAPEAVAAPAAVEAVEAETALEEYVTPPEVPGSDLGQAVAADEAPEDEGEDEEDVAGEEPDETGFDGATIAEYEAAFAAVEEGWVPAGEGEGVAGDEPLALIEAGEWPQETPSAELSAEATEEAPVDAAADTPAEPAEAAEAEPAPIEAVLPAAAAAVVSAAAMADIDLEPAAAADDVETAMIVSEFEAESPSETEVLAEGEVGGATAETGVAVEEVAARPAAFMFEPRLQPDRFLWELDGDGRFQFLSGDLARAVGPASAALEGLTWTEVADRLGLADGSIADAIASRDTWSGLEIDWPVEGTGLTVPVELSAIPVFGRDRAFRGYRGFGICRTADAIGPARRANVVPLAGSGSLAALEEEIGIAETAERAPALAGETAALLGAATAGITGADAVNRDEVVDLAAAEFAEPAEAPAAEIAAAGSAEATAEEPAAEIAGPAATAEEPAAEIAEPAATAEEPTAEIAEPAATAEEPAAEIAEPAAEVDETVAEVAETLADAEEEDEWIRPPFCPPEEKFDEAAEPEAVAEPTAPAAAPAEDAPATAEAPSGWAAASGFAALAGGVAAGAWAGEANGDEIAAPEPTEAAPAEPASALDVAGTIFEEVSDAGAAVAEVAEEHVEAVAETVETAGETAATEIADIGDEIAASADGLGAEAEALVAETVAEGEALIADAGEVAGELTEAATEAAGETIEVAGEAVEEISGTLGETVEDAGAALAATAAAGAAAIAGIAADLPDGIADRAEMVLDAEPARETAADETSAEAAMADMAAESPAGETIPAATDETPAELQVEPQAEAPAEAAPVAADADLPSFLPGTGATPAKVADVTPEATSEATPDTTAAEEAVVAFVDRALDDKSSGKFSGAEVVAVPTRGRDSKIVRLRTPRPGELEEAGARLAAHERSAFREIARALGARIEGDELEPEAPAGEPARPAVTPAPATLRGNGAGEAPKRPSASMIDARLLDRLPVGLLVLRGEELLHANRAVLQLLGHPDIESLARAGGLDNLFVDGPDWKMQSAEGRTPIEACASDGRRLPVDARLMSVSWQGEAAAMLMVDERSADAGRLEELEAIVGTAIDGVVTLGSKGDIRGLNARARDLLGYADDQIAGLPLIEIFAAESQPVVADYFASLDGDAVAAMLDEGREVEALAASGRTIPVHLSIATIGGTGGRRLAVLRDITRWKDAEREALAAKRAAENASALKSEFLARISHEIRTPLNAIIGFSEVMMAERFGPIGSDRYRGYVSDINASGTHLVGLVNDLLDLSKIEAGKLELNFQSVDLAEIVQAVVTIMQPQANRERIIIRTSLPAGVPPVVADQRSMRQIVLNLLGNAIRFTQAGGQVIVSTALEENGEVVLRVRDTGVGMSEKDIALALEPFRQLTTTPRGSLGGTGLGLPLTKALTEANRATFTIDSAVDEGTLITVAFPAQRVLAE